MSTAYSYPWIPDAGDGTYQNPLIHADYSDPDVIRHDDEFWMVASSFNCTPGLPILRSPDLVNWTLVNHAIQNVPHPSYNEVRPGCGVWAPSIRYHAGKYWIFFPMPDEGIYVTAADHPAGAWSEPYCLQAVKGWIDPCPFWDDDGNAYLAHAYANSRCGKRDKIHIRPMAPDCSRLLGEGTVVIDAPHHPYLEGPKVHKFDDWYYILAPGGGVPQGWQVVFRSKNIYGPYEEKIVLEKGSTNINGPHQGALVDIPNGEWWFVHFQDAGAFGRIVHMQPVEWKDGWPLMGMDYDGNGVGEPVPSWRKPSVDKPFAVAIPQTSDEFDEPRLGLQWQWFANNESSWLSLTARQGFARLFAQPSGAANLGLIPNLLLQKFPARGFVVETTVEFNPRAVGESAGLIIVGGNGFASVAVVNSAEGRRIIFQASGDRREDVAASPKVVRLRVSVDQSAKCVFSFAGPEEEFVWIDETFTPREGGWLGAKVGIYCAGQESGATAGYSDFDYFRFSSP